MFLSLSPTHPATLSGLCGAFSDSQEREQGSQDDPNVKRIRVFLCRVLEIFMSNTEGILDGVGDVLVSTEFGSAWD
jgi:hypothetical protein